MDRLSQGSSSCHRRTGFTVLELLTVFAVTSVLLGLLLPAVNSARETARQMQCANNLHQLGIALHTYHELNRGLPPGWRFDSSGETAFAWGTAILPHLEQAQLAARVDIGSRVDSADNRIVRGITPSVFLCPSDITEPTFQLFPEQGAHSSSGADSISSLAQLPSANYVGVFGNSDPDDVPGERGEGAFLANRSLRFAAFRRGLSNTLLVGERTARKLPSTWFGVVLQGEDAVARIVGNADKGPNRDDADECELDSRHPACVNFLWADGHVKSLSDSIDSLTYRRLANRR